MNPSRKSPHVSRTWKARIQPNSVVSYLSACRRSSQDDRLSDSSRYSSRLAFFSLPPSACFIFLSRTANVLILLPRRRRPLPPDRLFSFSRQFQHARGRCLFLFLAPSRSSCSARDNARSVPAFARCIHIQHTHPSPSSSLSFSRELVIENQFILDSFWPTSYMSA